MFCSFTKSFRNHTFSFENPLDVRDGSGGSTWDVNFDFGNHNAKLIQLLNYSSIAKLIWAGGASFSLPNPLELLNSLLESFRRSWLAQKS